MNNIRLFIATNKSKNEYKSLNDIEFFNKHDIDYRIKYNNTDGLSKVYNDELELSINDNIDYLILMHDDVILNDLLFKDKLLIGFEKYDIIGIAGANQFDVSKNNRLIAWHTCSNRNNYCGGLFHPKNKNKLENINDIYYTHFGNFGDAIVLDGVFLAINIKKLNDIRFDEDFKFDFYDLTFSLQCYLKKLKVGTIPISMTHLSHGNGILENKYIEAQNIFLNKYCHKNN